MIVRSYPIGTEQVGVGGHNGKTRVGSKRVHGLQIDTEAEVLEDAILRQDVSVRVVRRLTVLGVNGDADVVVIDDVLGDGVPRRSGAERDAVGLIPIDGVVAEEIGAGARSLHAVAVLVYRHEGGA